MVRSNHVTRNSGSFFISHSIILGRYLSWLIKSGICQVFTDTFSVFREAAHANVHYNLYFWISVLIGVIWTIFCFIVKKNRVIALKAGLSSFLEGRVFFASGFAEVEEAVAMGMADEIVRRFFVSCNIPMHTCFAVFYTLCFFLLLLSNCREISLGTSLSIE